MLDKNVRLAMIHSIDKKAIVDKLLRGYAVVIDTLEAPQYAAFDPSHQGEIRSRAGEAAAGQVRLSARTSRSSSPSRPRAASSRRTTR